MKHFFGAGRQPWSKGRLPDGSSTTAAGSSLASSILDDCGVLRIIDWLCLSRLMAGLFMDDLVNTGSVRTPRDSGRGRGQGWKESRPHRGGETVSETGSETGSETDDDFKPLTRQEAIELRSRSRLVSPARLLVLQGLVGLLTAIVAGLLGQGWSTGLSALYGAAVVVGPGAVLAWALRARPATVSSAQRAVSFLFWELVKIVLAVAMLILAPWVVAGLSWLALLAGMILSMKVYGLALLWRGR